MAHMLIPQDLWVALKVEAQADGRTRRAYIVEILWNSVSERSALRSSLIVPLQSVEPPARALRLKQAIDAQSLADAQLDHQWLARARRGGPNSSTPAR